MHSIPLTTFEYVIGLPLVALLAGLLIFLAERSRMQGGR